jgi:hypothetical protein
MHLEKGVLVDITELISSGDKVSDSEIFIWEEFPKLVLIETWELNTSWDKHAISSGSNLLKGSLDTIENCFQDT